MITIYELDGAEPEPIAEYDGGEWTEGAERMEPIFGEEPPTQDELLESLDGPRMFASLPEDGEDEKGIDEADHRDPEEVLDDPDEPTTNSLGVGKTRVDNVHDAPDGAVVKMDGDGLYYEEPSPAHPPDPAGEAVGALEKFYDSLTRG